ncbi:MAG: DUF1822 family protein [Phormidesmis sp.]
MVIEQSQHTEHPGAIALPITLEHQQMAQRFTQQCPFAEKVPQIERNTLAVCAVNAYLQMMGIATDVATSDSWNPMMQMMVDASDLRVPGVGALACRAMMPGDEACYVPPEDWSERAGYIAVVVDVAESQATLMGFMPAIEDAMMNEDALLEEGMPITQFSPIETLLDHIYTLKTATEMVPATDAVAAPLVDGIQAAITTATTRMSQWFEGVVTNGWQTVDELINPSQMGFAFRSAGAARTPESGQDIRRAKAINLAEAGLPLGQSIQIALIIQLSPASAECIDIILQVHPLGDESRLPEGISLSIFDDGNNLVRNATSRAIDNYIQLQVVGEPGESFSVQIRKGEALFEEMFEI